MRRRQAMLWGARPPPTPLRPASDASYTSAGLPGRTFPVSNLTPPFALRAPSEREAAEEFVSTAASCSVARETRVK